MWTTCFAAKLRAGAIESTIAIGPSNGSASSMPTSSDSSRRSASTSDSPELTPPPGSSQYSLPGFSCRQSRIRSLPAEERRDADARLGRHQCPDEPKPPSPRSLPGSSSTSRSVDSGHGDEDELGDPHAGLDDERLAPVGVVEDHAQLAAVARVDEPGRVHDRDPVLRREAGARHDEPGVALGDRDGDAGSDERALARAELVPLARDEVEPGVAGIGARRQDGVVAEPRDGQVDHAAGELCGRSLATRKRAKRRTSRAGRRARISTPSSRSTRASIGGPSA